MPRQTPLDIALDKGNLSELLTLLRRATSAASNCHNFGATPDRTGPLAMAMGALVRYVKPPRSRKPKQHPNRPRTDMSDPV